MADSYRQTLKIWDFPRETKFGILLPVADFNTYGTHVDAFIPCIAMHRQLWATSDTRQICISCRINFLFRNIT